MSGTGEVLFDDGFHKVIMFCDLVEEDDHIEAVQSNQFLIVHGDSGILLDPGGAMTYNKLYMAISHYFSPKKLSAIFASHQDPDIVASLSRWLSFSDTKLIISELWTRFVPHFCPEGKTTDRIIPLADKGVWMTIEGAEYGFIPAHYLHSEGNFQLYDPISKILFSGDLGVSLVDPKKVATPIETFKDYIPYMEGFHQRYMISNKACRLWAHMIRELDIDMILPQHGSPMLDQQVIQDFINWVAQLRCGVDLVDQDTYQIPKLHMPIEDMKVV
ncbi:MAG: MBL fold metallo-hydrolase [Wohlfahrtiimonas sp.]